MVLIKISKTYQYIFLYNILSLSLTVFDVSELTFYSDDEHVNLGSDLLIYVSPAWLLYYHLAIKRALSQKSIMVYSDRTRQRHNDGVKHNALELEHMFVNGHQGKSKRRRLFVMQEEIRRVVSSVTLRLLC